MTNPVPSTFHADYFDCCGALVEPGTTCGCPGRNAPVVCPPADPTVITLVLRSGRLTRVEPAK